ncbi:HAMP domain-containing histidine kinase [Clostridium swellfunianum]|uniref:sensor histidine kinase n=1 Tax=Clostridium swellfunianum TaxID=1367462 RepID=UPI002030F87D|nr:ATP-binding protein [Clostridium swellfunianum]MCM0650675.1 HAMP domain-containing histidine kinase [Clostridium swellfunianum]
MQTIRKRLSILFVICSILAIFLITLFVNTTINKKFNQYMADIQNKRYERIVVYLEEIYKREGNWNDNSGIELMHEAYMGNYCLTLLDINKKTVWGMDPNEIKNNLHFNTMLTQDKGVYNSKRFEIHYNGKVVGFVDIGQYAPILLTEEDVNFKKSINESIIASGILTLLIIIFVSLYFSKQFSRPIKAVANMSVNLSKGNFDAKSNVESNIEELENLRNSVNILAEKLKYQDSLRKRLVSDISHEIRTPLNVLQNNLEAMIDGVLPVTSERLSNLNEEVVRFGKLLNSLNALKEFETESIKLDFETILLNELIKDICKDFQTAVEKKNIKLRCKFQNNSDYSITGDRDKLKQVFINLLSNSVKFTEAEGEITFELYETYKNIVVEIKDTGVGIKKEDLPFIFERLYRGDKSRSEIEGSGLGLTIVKNILKLHSASIEVKSEEGKGTTFKISFIHSVDK